MKTELEFSAEALSIFLTKGFTIAGDIVTPADNTETVPSQEDWDAKVSELKVAYAAQEYARKREAEYPSIEECVHAILDDDLTALQEKRQAIKTKYPKG